MLKNPAKVIQRFLIILSILSFLVLFINIGGVQVLTGLALLIAAISAVLDILMLIVGIRFNTLVQKRSRLVTSFLWINLVWIVLNTIYAYKIGTSSIGAFIFLAVYIAAMVYAIRKIKEIAVVSVGESSAQNK